MYNVYMHRCYVPAEIVHSTNDPSKSYTESSRIEYEIESSMIEQTFQFTEEISESNEDDEQEFLLQPVDRELLPVDLTEIHDDALTPTAFSGLESNNDLQDNNQASCSENVPLSTENEAEEENEWVLDYLEKIQDALQEEMENIMRRT